MEEVGFRSFLHRRKLGAHSIASYVSNNRRVERLLDVDLQVCDLSAIGLSNLEAGLRRLQHLSGMSDATLSNCMSAVRSYIDYRVGAAPCRADRAAQQEEKTSSALADGPVCGLPELLDRHESTLRELRRYGILRTGSLVGDYAEWLFAQAFGWSLAPNSQSGHDAADATGFRYQIKARRMSTSGGSRQLGAFRDLRNRSFDALAAVLFDASLGVQRAILLPYEIVLVRATPDLRTNSWRFMLNEGVWSLPGARDVTAELRSAATLPIANGSPASMIMPALLDAVGCDQNV